MLLWPVKLLELKNVFEMLMRIFNIRFSFGSLLGSILRVVVGA